jgi:hypothetical protein
MKQPPYVFWAIWIDLSWHERVFLLLLFGVCVYSLCWAAATMFRLHSARLKADPALVALLRLRSTHVRNLTVTTFYLFGFVLFFELETIANFSIHTSVPLGNIIFKQFLIHCGFAANVFFILLVLQLIQWIVHGLINSCERRLIARERE